MLLVFGVWMSVWYPTATKCTQHTPHGTYFFCWLKRKYKYCFGWPFINMHISCLFFFCNFKTVCIACVWKMRCVRQKKKIIFGVYFVQCWWPTTIATTTTNYILNMELEMDVDGRPAFSICSSIYAYYTHSCCCCNNNKLQNAEETFLPTHEWQQVSCFGIWCLFVLTKKYIIK